MSRCDERRCGLEAEPVWAVYPDATAEQDGHVGTATVHLPLRRCPNGHLSGWRAGDDFLGDVVLDLREIDDTVLGGDGIPPRRRMLRGRVCGACGAKLVLHATGRRLTGEVRAFVHASPDPIRFDVDLPDLGCGSCGAAPSRHGAPAANLATELVGWMLAWIAAAMPPERAAEIHPRDPGGT